MVRGALLLLLCCIPLFARADPIELLPELFQQFKSLFHFEPVPAVVGRNVSGPLISTTRLPKGVAPVNYELTISTYLPDYGVQIDDIKKFTFDANVWITFKNQIPVQKIVLNQKDLYLYSTYLVDHVGKLRQVFGIVHKDHEQYIIQTGFLPPGQHRLYIEYRGKMDVLNSGLFMSKYKTVENKTRVAAVTQMEPSSARRLVPCFDEPEYKATWDVNIIHPQESQAVANQKEIKTEDFNNGWKMTSFETTPIMSSYLLAIGVFNFTHYEGYTNRGMRVRVYASPHQQNGSIALKQAIELIEIYEKKFQIPIPLAKMDLVAAEDLFEGAMENWGLIYFHPRALLSDNQGSIGIIAHEIAHYWFGNLVTMKWWDNLYLNEGLATYMSLEGLKRVEKGKYAKQTPYAFLESVVSALKRDRRRDSHPLVQTLSHHSEINTVIPKSGYLPEITYAKGCVFFSMISAVMGKEKFDTAIVNYLNKYAFQNVEQDQLFAEFDKVIGEDQLGPDGKRLDVTKFAHQWTLQMGFPLVTLGESNSTHCEVTQERYVQGKDKEDPRYTNNSYGYKWDVPIWLQEDNETTLYWLPANGSLFIPCTEDEAIILNRESNYYVTNYRANGYKNIIENLNDVNLSVFSEAAMNFAVSVALLNADSRISQRIFTELSAAANKNLQYLLNRLMVVFSLDL